MGVGDDIAPRFTQKPVLKQEDNGKLLVFQCTLEAAPKPEIKWFQGTTPLSQSDRIKMRVEPAGGNNYNVMMDIKGVTQADAGTYKVVAKNKLGEVSASINLNFSAPGQKQQDGIAPNFTQKPSTRQADNGKKLLFECQLTADPVPQISWFRDDQQIKDGGRIKIQTDPKGNNNYFIVLEINGVNAQDAGNYRVTAKNALGESNATIRLNFDSDDKGKPQGTRPSFTTKPAIKQVGGKIIFDCKVTADPKPTITWMKGTQALTDGGRYKMIQTGDKNNYDVSMEIDKPGKDDGGEYKCLAKNSLGDSTATITLNFEGAKKGPEGKAPQFLAKPVIKQEKTNLIMTCNLEAKPQPNIKWFQGTTELKMGGRYDIKLTPSPGKADSYTATLNIKDPKPTDGGSFKCTASNDFGESNANITLNFQVVKKIFVIQVFRYENFHLGENGAEQKDKPSEDQEKPAAPKPAEEKPAPAKPAGTAPTFTEKPVIKQEGKNLIVHCKCKANPKPTFSWYKSGLPLKETFRIKTRVDGKGDDYDTFLDLINVTKNDAAEYKVVAKNAHGEGNATITVNMDEPPKAAEPPPQFQGVPQVTLEEGGKRLCITQKVKCKTKPTAMWYFLNKPIKHGGKYFLEISQDRDCYNIVCEVLNPKDLDSGEYKFSIKTPGGEGSGSARVDLKALMAPKPKVPKGSPPSFTQKLVPTEVLDGDACDLIAKVAGNEPIEVVWSKDGDKLKHSKDCQITFKDNVCRLYIPEVYPDDGGKYQIDLENDFGKAMTSATLNVSENPDMALPEVTPMLGDDPTGKVVEQKIPEPEQVKPVEKIQPQIKEPEKSKAPEKKKDNKFNRTPPRKPKMYIKQPTTILELEEADDLSDGYEGDDDRPSIPLIVMNHDDVEYEDAGPRKISVSKKKDEKPEKKIEGPTHALAKKPDNVTIVEGEDLKVNCALDVKPGLQAPNVKFFRGKRELKDDTRTRIIHKDKGSSLNINKARFSDESKYTVIVEQEGVPVDQATFSVFVKDPKDSAMDFRSLLKHRDHKKKNDDDDDIDWGSLKPVEGQDQSQLQKPPQMKKERRPSLVDSMKQHLADSEVERRESAQAMRKLSRDNLEVEKATVDKLEALEQSRRSSMQQFRRPSLVDVIPDWPTLQHREAKKEKPDKYIVELDDVKATEGDKKAIFESEFCKKNAKVKWFKNKLEIFAGHKYHFENDNMKYRLVVNNVKLEDGGKYTLELNGVKSGAWLYVEAKAPHFEFTQKLPEKFSQTKRKEVDLECFVSDPRARVKWFKNGQPIEIPKKGDPEYQSGKMEIQRRENRCILRIKDCQPDDEAEYTCTCGDAKTTCQFKVTDPEWDFMKLLDDVEGIERDRATFECDVNDPEAEVKWFRNDKNKVKELTSGGKYEIQVDGFKRRLVVKNCHSKDDGPYTCKVLDKETTANLFVEPDVKFFKKLENKREREKGTLVLECKASNPHNQPVKWLKDGEPINKDDPRLEVTRKGELYKIVIKNLTREDAGQYACQVGERSSKCEVIVDELPKPPQINAKDIPEEIIVKKGEVIEIGIPFIGVPMPVGHWKKDGNPLSEADTDIRMTDTLASIRIPDAQRGDTGQYELTLTNEVGSEVIPIPVRVLDVPGRPGEPLDVVDVFADKCALLWDRPKDDGGSPIKHYIVEMKDSEKDSDKFEQVCTTEDLEVDVTGLKEGHRYQFRVRAVNDQGTSEPLLADGEIIAKDPWDPSDPPQDTNVEDYDKDYVEIGWKPPINDGGAPIEKYVIEKCEKHRPEWVPGIEVPGDKRAGTVSGLTENREYIFRVSAVNKAGKSEPSEATPPVLTKSRRVKPRIMNKDDLKPIRVKVGKDFTIPVEYIGEPTPKIEWKKKGLQGMNKQDKKEEPIEPSDHISIDNKTEKKSTLTCKEPSRKDTAMYNVTVTNKHGSDTADVEVVVLGPPSMPKGPIKVSNITAESATLEWGEPEDLGGSPIDGYKIEKMDTKKGQWEPVREGVKGTKVTVPKLKEGQEYKFRVAAMSQNGNSEPLETKPIIAKKPYDEPFPPGQPKCVDRDRTHIKMKWEPPENDGGNPVKSYDVERKEPKTNRWAKINKEPITTCEYDDNKVGKEKEYEYRVVAINDAGPSEPSVASKVIQAKPEKEAPKVSLDGLFGANEIRVKAGEPLDIPVGVSGTPTPTVSWEKNGRPVDNRAKCTSSEEDAKLHVDKAERGDTGKYTITVTNESGSMSADVNVIVLDKPGAPEGPLAVSDVFADMCRLSWNPPTDNGGAEVTGYVVEKCEDGKDFWEKVPGLVNGTAHPVKGLKEGKKYKFRVKAENKYGAGAPLETDKSTLAKNPFDTPDAPKDLEIDRFDKNSCDLVWKKPDFDGGADISGYIVEKRPKGGDWVPVNNFPVAGTKFSALGLKEGQVLEFRVSAVNQGGTGKPSKSTKPHTVKDPIFAAGAPGTPNLDKITPNSAELSWTKPTKDGGGKILGYVIEKKKGHGDWETATEVPANALHGKVNDLVEGEQYQFRIRAVNEAGPGDPSKPTQAITAEYQAEKPHLDLSGIKDITVKQGQKYQIRVPYKAWPKPSALWTIDEEELPSVARIHTKVEDDAVMLTNDKSQRADSGKYKITLTNPSGNHSGFVNVNVLSPPAKPEGPFTASDINGDELTLSWGSPKDDGGEKISNYIIEKKKKGSPKWSKVTGTAKEPTCQVRNLEPGTEYEFRVMAENAQGISEPLETDKAILAKLPYDTPGAPGTPKCLEYTEDSITLTWTPPKNDGGNIIKGYVVEKKEKGKPDWTKANISDILTNEFQVKGLQEGKEYEFRVAARNNAGVGDWAQTSEAIKARAAPVAPKVDKSFTPRDVIAKVGEPFKIVIPYNGNPIPDTNWSIGTRDLFEGDRIKFENTPNELKLLNKKATKEDAGRYTLTMKNEKGQDTIALNVIVVDKPSKPEGPLECKDVTPDSCTLTWNKPKDDGGSPVSNYVVEKCDTRTGRWEPVSKFVRGTKYEVMGLDEGHEYKFRVSAENENGVSEPLEVLEPVLAQHPYTAPGSPSNVHVLDVDEDSVTLSFNAPTHDGGKKIQGYCVEYKDPTSGRWKMHNDIASPDLKYTVDGLKKDKDYEFRVCAKNIAGLGEPSKPTDVIRTKPKYTLSGAPGVPTFTVGKTFVDLKWDKPRNDGGAKIKGYIVEKRAKDSDAWVKVNDYPVSDCGYTVNGLPEGGEFEFRVRAVNQAGEGEPSGTTGLIKIKEKIVGTAPEFIKKLHPTEMGPLGGEMIFSVQIHGKPMPDVTWYKNGVPMGSTSRTRLTQNDDIFTLRFTELYANDEGEIKCDISNPLGRDSCTCNFKIQSPPKFGKDFHDQQVELGEQFKIKIPFSGTGPFEVKVRKNGREVVENGRIKIMPFDDYVSLTINDANLDDAGQYKVEVSNAGGAAELGFGLKVVGAPEKPTGPLGVSDITKSTCRLQWKPPKTDGGSKITHYVVERQEVGKPYWVTVSSRCKDCNQDVQGLYENNQYAFRVSAVNEFGQSEPLTAETPIIAKMPFDKPDAPGVPEITEVGCDFVSLTWEKPKHDGGGRIKGYWIDKREHGTDNWSRVNLQPCITNIINIPKLIEDKRYEFRVFAENEAGMSKPSMNSQAVKIKDPKAAVIPEFSSGLRKCHAQQGKSAKFECEVSGKPSPDIQWFKGTREIYSSPKFEIYNEGDKQVLIVHDVFGEDQDEYSCRASNHGGSRTSRANLEISSPPKITVPKRFQDVAIFEKGESAVMKIPFTGNPKPTITWMHDGEEVKGRNYHSEVTERHAILTIKDANKDQDGPYRITAKNDLGSDSAVIKIQINDRPDPPRYPTCENIRDESVLLSWKPPLNDGGSFITQYVIEKCEPPNSNWIRVAVSRMCFHNITSLSANKEYQFRVVAENFYGKSDPCDPTAVIKTDESDAIKKKRALEDGFGRKVRGTGPKVDNYDKYYHDLWKKYVPQPVSVRDANVSDYYEILEELGSGAFGVVHRCVEKATGRVFVAKFINTPYPLDKFAVKNEINVMNQCHHPKLLQLKDAFEDKYEMCLIFEFLAGGELFDRIAAEDYKMTECEVINYMRQICDGLKHMHENSIVHLDVKPENVMCTTKNSNEVKMIDFGLATKLNPDEIVKVTTATAEFAAPEIVDREPVGFYTDMWAVGVLAYVLLSGLSPFAGEDDLETLANVQRCDWEFADDAFANISPEAKDFIRKLLIRQPQRRMTVHECLDHDWMKGDLSGRTTRIPSSRYDSIRSKMRAKYADWPAPNPAIGRIANFGALRKNRPKDFSIFDSYFDRKEAAPRFIRKPRNILAAEGQSTKFDCKIIGASPPIVTWSYDNSVLSQSVKYMQKYRGNEYELKISRLKMADKGLYTVIAENSFGKREEHATLKVEVNPELQRTNSRDTTPMRRSRRPSMSPAPEVKPIEEAPKISFGLRPRLIQAGSEFKLLTCVQSTPVPKVTWYKDNKDVSKDPHYMCSYSGGVATIEVQSAKIADTGTYTCRAINELGEHETSSRVVVEDRAHDFDKSDIFKSHKQSRTARTTKSGFSFADSSSSYNETSTSSSSTRTSNRSSRRVEESSYEDSYSSSRSSRRDKKREPSVEAPEFTTQLSPLSLNEGDRLKLTCTVKGQPEPEVEWFYNGQLMQSDDAIKISAIAGRHTLTIDSCIIDDDGNYVCKAKNPGGQASSRTSVQVTENRPVKSSTPPQIKSSSPRPDFIEHPAGVSLEDGDKATLESRISGNPEVEWYRGHELIKDSADFQYHKEGDMFKLIIAEVFPEDTGIYKCVAKNSSGTTTSSFYIKVEEPDVDPLAPVFLSHPQSQSIDEGTAFKASCTLDEADSVKWSKDGTEVENTGRFKFTQDENKFTFEIPAALATDSGEYTVTAKNSRGSSQWVFTLSVAVSSSPVADIDVVKLIEDMQ
ncbi:twitchin-like isoform X18 [Mytilus edulis]|uniref:twitchin-like isoform X18 n=1 Tax=Mytilus edulis TaxID=6550 RepID=UPI0039EFB6A1